jgi:hypothetical protein
MGPAHLVSLDPITRLNRQEPEWARADAERERRAEVGSRDLKRFLVSHRLKDPATNNVTEWRPATDRRSH